jgi:CubicO group peptidase (beta-lactamase class C family)
MIAALVEKGKLSWDSNLGEVFRDLALPPDVRAITLLELLAHRSGLRANPEWLRSAGSDSLMDQRTAAVARLASVELLSSPGSKFSYSNWGYVIAAAMAEKATGMSYEDLMRTLLFEPLQMHSAGYGAAGTRDKVDEPWGHTAEGGASQADNPLVMAPAGGLHCSLEDWGKFIRDQLHGAEGRPALLKRESYSRLHSAPFEENYALGWGVANRPWGGGRVFTHAGSNTLNLAVVWMAPARDFAMLVVCNQGNAERACDEVCAGLIALRTQQTRAEQPSSN